MAGSAIVVLGMHRSGTSALTRLLALAGAGLPATLFPAVEGDNDTGYWESAPVIDFHQALLWHLGTGALDPALPDREWFDSADAAREAHRLAHILKSEWGEHPLWVVKEPRLSRLVPLWRAALASLDRTWCAVHCLREPAEVAGSLAARGGEIRSCELLWAQHVALAERDSRGVPRVLVTFDMLLRDWRDVLARIAARGAALRIAQSSEEASRFLDARRRHHASGAAPIAMEPVRALRDLVFEAAARDRDPDPVAMDRVIESITRISPVACPR